MNQWNRRISILQNDVWKISMITHWMQHTLWNMVRYVKLKRILLAVFNCVYFLLPLSKNVEHFCESTSLRQLAFEWSERQPLFQSSLYECVLNGLGTLLVTIQLPFLAGNTMTGADKRLTEHHPTIEGIISSPTVKSESDDDQNPQYRTFTNTSTVSSFIWE